MLQYLEAFPIYRQTDWQADDTTSASLIFAFAVIFASAVFVFEYYLDIRQYFKFVTASGIPKELNHPLISEDLFKKALSYGKDKSSFGLAESLIMFIEGISLIFAGYLPFVWDGAGSIATYLGLISPNNSMQYVEIVTTVAFVFLLTLHDTFISLPFSLYRTFVIEQKHGFNKSTLLLFIRDKLLSLTLTLVIGAPVLSLMIFIVRYTRLDSLSNEGICTIYI
jgi:STE24 endopeptidase